MQHSGAHESPCEGVTLDQMTGAESSHAFNLHWGDTKQELSRLSCLTHSSLLLPSAAAPSCPFYREILWFSYSCGHKHRNQEWGFGFKGIHCRLQTEASWEPVQAAGSGWQARVEDPSPSKKSRGKWRKRWGTSTPETAFSVETERELGHSNHWWPRTTCWQAQSWTRFKYSSWWGTGV